MQPAPTCLHRGTLYAGPVSHDQLRFVAFAVIGPLACVGSVDATVPCDRCFVDVCEEDVARLELQLFVFCLTKKRLPWELVASVLHQGRCILDLTHLVCHL